MDELKYYRFKTLKVINANKPDSEGRRRAQRLAIDGEDMIFEKFVKFETLHNELEIIVDYDKYMRDFKHFNQSI